MFNLLLKLRNFPVASFLTVIVLSSHVEWTPLSAMKPVRLSTQAEKVSFLIPLLARPGVFVN